MKRLFDVLISLLGLIFLFPFFVIIGIAIKLNSSGPIFFGQQRIGRSFKPFLLYKFRSMVQGAPSRGPSITIGSDSRITSLGNFLRRWKLDELPQLWNVLKGEMSLVGPRPEMEKYVRMFESDYQTILKVRPGITDWASVQLIHEQEFLGQFQDGEKAYIEIVLPQKLELQKKYALNCSVWTDLRILASTLKALILPNSSVPETSLESIKRP